MKPVIGVDGSRLSRSEKTGTENYADALIHGLVDDDEDASWRVYLDNTADRQRWPSHVEIRTITAPRLWTHGRMSMEMATRPPDLLFVPAHVVPLLHPRSVVTIHDLGYLHVPESHDARQRRMLELTTRWNARMATTIIVPSNVTRQDLVDRYGTSPDKIRVVYHGVDERFRHVAEDELLRVRDALALERPYLLAVGTVHPRKNLPTLAQAAARLLASGRDLDLVVAGKDGWNANEVHDQLRAVGLGARLRTLKYVSSHDLPGLYRGAACFVQPSLFEGFGMPVVEAMAAGTAVVCARTASLPEIAGDGADYFDALDDQHLTVVLERILSDGDYLNRLIARGRERSRSFSWSRCVRETTAVLGETLPA